LTRDTSPSSDAPKPDAKRASNRQYYGSAEQFSERRSDQYSRQSVEKWGDIEIEVRREQDNEPAAENHQLCSGPNGLRFTAFPGTHFVSAPNCNAND
jgi:hypothetical protein